MATSVNYGINEELIVWGMIVDIQTRRLHTIGQLRAFIKGNEAVVFHPQDRGEVYTFVRETQVGSGRTHEFDPAQPIWLDHPSRS